MQAIKKIFSILIRISISIILLILLFKINKINIHELLEDIKGADKLLLSAACFVAFFMYLLCFIRWQILLKAAGINIPLKRLIISYSGGVFFSIFLPSTIGGDVVRTADLAAHTNRAKEVIATVFLDRLSGYMGLVAVIIPALILGAGMIEDEAVFISVGAIVALLALILLVLFNKSIYAMIGKYLDTPGAGRIKEAIKGLHHEIHIFRHRKKIMFYNLVLSFLVQIVSPLSVYLIALSLGVKINILYFFIFMPIIGAIILLPISIGGLGLRESSFVFYFAKVGVIKQLALAMSLLSFAFVVLYGALGGLIYVLTVRHRRVQCDQSPTFPPQTE